MPDRYEGHVTACSIYPSGDSTLLSQEILLITLRAKAREDKNFTLADEVKAHLKKAGITLTDLPARTNIFRKY